MKTLGWIAAAVMALAVAACGQGGSAPKTETAAPAASASAPVALSPEEIATQVAALPAPYNGGDYEHGRRIAAQCRSCHTLNEGGRNLVGPNLHGLFGREAGSVSGFAYSDAVRGSGITWDEAQLEQWLSGPRNFLPGNRMAFPGVPNETDRRDLITFLHIETTR
jgi:cytochrome c